jgi:PAS domain S-box-containing protein
VSDARALALAGAPARRKRTKAPPRFVAEPPTAAFFETTSDAILRFDAQQRVVYVNPALERATALPRASFIGRRLAEVDVAETHVEQRLELCLDRRHRGEKLERLLDGDGGHVEEDFAQEVVRDARADERIQ